MIIKYYVERSFKDKYTKKDITAKTIIDVTVERMKELNSKRIGRVVDIIENENITKEVKNESTNIKVEETDNNEKTFVDNTDGNTNNNVYTEEELSKMTVNDLKELAESLNIELTKAKKEEIIEEILLNNK